MKNLKQTGWGFTALWAVMIGFISCVTPPDDSTDLANEQNEVIFDNKDAEDDAGYLVEAAKMFQQNVRWGELAALKATSKEVKGFGSTMAKAHTADLAALQSLATGKSISLPAAPMENTKDANDDLNDKKGLVFDREYCDKVIGSHKDAIDNMEAIEKNAQDPEVRSWATKMLPKLRTNLGSAETLYGIVKNQN